jgi:endonuclease/exonuclease/phosphatase family metal-dependent hydrolase
MKKIYLWVLFCISISSLSAQDYLTHVFFANQSQLPINLSPELEGTTQSIEVRKLNFIPFEITHDHAVTIGVGDFIGGRGKDHNEGNSSLALDRRRFFNTNNFSARLQVRTGSDLLFTITVAAQDLSGLFCNVFYNIEYPDGSLELEAPGLRVRDNAGTYAQVAREISYRNEAYKLVFGVYDEQQDNTDNLIFSLSKVVDTLYRYDPPIEDTLNPNLLHIYCYNPGILKPLDINDQDEDERTAVMHKAIPKNMDILVFQEFFEPRNVSEIFNNLQPYYPYYTGQHNEILIPIIGKDGGVRIMSKYPILEEAEISYSDNGCIPSDFFSLFANKGVKYAKINKQGQMIHVFGTHTSIQPCDLYVMGQFMASFDIPEEDVVIMAGDFNVDMNRFKNGSDDYTILLDTINALEPTYLSFLNDRSYTGTTSGLSHMYCCNPDGRQHLDYIFVSSQHKIPTLLTNRSMQARLNEPDESFGIFDLGDHLPLYARIEFPAIEADAASVSTCIGNVLELKANLIVPAEDGRFQWYRNGEAIPGANAGTLQVNISSGADFGNYTCQYQYEYLPDTFVNNFFDPSYMDYNWYFRGKTPGKSSANFEIRPENPTESCAGVITNIIETKVVSFDLYPNPTEQFITIAGSQLSDFVGFDVIDATGRILAQTLKAGNDTAISIDVSGFPPGIYFLRGQHEGGVIAKSFVKM